MVRANELSPLPELIAVFKEAADVQTSDMLQLPVPETVYEDVVLEPSEEQREMVSALGKRAEQVRNRLVEPKEDNMLKITSDGRKLALDQRLMNDMLPDDPNSKVNACVERVFSIWDEGKAERTTQLLFCDLSTPKGDGTFNVYDDIREKLVAKGVPREEVCFIHEADTEAKKIALFARMRSGKARVLIGSSAKCGAGMNIQDRLIALHHLDVPWRPSDIQQREGRIVRQGNQNPQVKIFRYVTKSTFDSYSWQLLEQKQKFIGQIMTSKSPVRSADDIDEAALSYAEVKALASGNPLIKEKMQLDNDVSRLKLMKSNYQSQVYQMQDDIAVNFPKRIAAAQELIVALKADIETAKALPTPELESEQTPLDMVIGGKHFTDRKEAGLAIIAACTGLKEIHSNGEIGSYGGFKLSVTYDVFSTKFNMSIQGMTSRSIEVSKDPYTNIRRIQASIANIPSVLEQTQRQLETLQQQLENTNAEVGKPFPKEQELTEKLARLSELNRLLDNGQSQPARETSDIVADQMRKPSIRDRLKAAQRESQRPQTNDRNRHKTNTMIL